MSNLANQNIYTVSRLNAEVRRVLESEMGIVWLVGEISNFSAPVSGHWYLTLKDSRAQVKAAMFKGRNRLVQFRPQNGQQVLIKARLSLYEPRGDYQIIIDSMQPEGDGRLQQEFEQLKMKLAGEGLFSQDHKHLLPEHPRCVGIVTSKTGAALHDILNVLKRRDPSLPVIIYPTMVQGNDAALHIAQAIGCANSRNECDVLIVGRGGGSLEDLWCFNNEIVARTIYSSQIPVISAVGHEVDVTIADFVADVRAPTPSAAAELVSRDNSDKRQAFVNYQHKLLGEWRYYVSQHKNALQQLQYRLNQQHPMYRLQRQQQLLDDKEARLRRAIERHLTHTRQHIARQEYRLQLQSPVRRITSQKHALSIAEGQLKDAMQRQLLKRRYQFGMLTEKLDTVSPLSTLSRGYSITQDEQGTVIHNTTDVKPGDKLITRVADGEIYSTVTSS
ncbi:exodeoxyribonuclease VII large subunit [Vibrio palustris]|uniref:Exodeoxyribonuclease 7 large subunit n=1 Tax=Vibrio palustris TaxID=1918946 RepID=A0A1R4B895_9VIBR|nr:exodeoxyribonuclease VII large subunit [Vibrio palustris]SJL85143.1 Exodeoxyribonuclease 7 large subunit [Vibrio palustris]